MSEETISSAADRIQAAADAIVYTEPDIEEAVEETTDAEESTEEAPEEEAEPAAEAAPEEEPAAEAPAEDAGKQFAALRRHERKFEERQAQFVADIDRREAELKEREAGINAIAEAIKTNPEEAWAMMAKKAGKDADEQFQHVAKRKISGGEPSPAELAEQLQDLRQELARRDEQAANQAKQSQKQTAQQRYQATVQGYVAKSANLDPDEYPSLTALPPDVLKGRVRDGVVWALNESPKTTFPQLLKTLDDFANEEYLHQERSRSVRASKSPSESSEATRVPDKPAAPSRTISNRTQAQTPSRSNGASSLPSKDERLKRAAAALEGM